MKWFRWFRRKREYMYFGSPPPPLPECPFGCDRRVLHDVIMGGEKRDIVFRPLFACEHHEQALRHAAFDQQYEQWYDPKTEEWTVYPRGA